MAISHSSWQPWPILIQCGCHTEIHCKWVQNVSQNAAKSVLQEPQ
jgi:hypothetical protein